MHENYNTVNSKLVCLYLFNDLLIIFLYKSNVFYHNILYIFVSILYEEIYNIN